MAMCPYHELMYISHGEVALPSLLVDLVEAVMVLLELPPRLLLFLPPLPPPLPLVRCLLFLFWLLLLGNQDDGEGCGLAARGAVLV
jgi:hypothetical protein